jgi:alkylation response protein AidB-like acyl-CoA dehydrogenase
MSYFPLTSEQQDWQDRAASVAARDLAPRAADTDRKGEYPVESLDALKREGFWALRVSKEHGGAGADLLSTVLVVEELAKKCASTAMCYKMHLEASEVINRIATPYQVERFVRPMAKGEVFCTVAGSESWTDGTNWTSGRQSSAVRRVEGGYQMENVRKSYVTSAGHATHFHFSCRIGEDTSPNDTSILFVERAQVKTEILEPWNGLGMRGNESSPLRFDGFVPAENRLGNEHTVSRDVMNLFTPVLGLTYAAAYLGIASGAFELAIEEGTRKFATGSRRLENAINQRRVAEMATQIEGAQTLLHSVASMFDNQRLKGILPVLQAKVTCSQTAVDVTQGLMTIFGGTAFASRLPFERYFRDARAGMVMGLANDAAYQQMAPMIVPPDPETPPSGQR